MHESDAIRERKRLDFAEATFACSWIFSPKFRMRDRLLNLARSPFVPVADIQKPAERHVLQVLRRTCLLASTYPMLAGAYPLSKPFGLHVESEGNVLVADACAAFSEQRAVPRRVERSGRVYRSADIL